LKAREAKLPRLFSWKKQGRYDEHTAFKNIKSRQKPYFIVLLRFLCDDRLPRQTGIGTFGIPLKEKKCKSDKFFPNLPLFLSRPVTFPPRVNKSLKQAVKFTRTDLSAGAEGCPA